MNRLLVFVASLAVAANLSVAATPAGAADTPAFVLGSGAASGSVARARLFYGGLSLPLGVGTTSASYTNQQSKALGIALDLGAYLGLAGDVPPEFVPSTIDSNSGDREAHGNLEAGEAVARVNLRATSVPASSSEVRMTDLDLPVLVRVEGAHALSTTEVRERRQRRAAAVVEVARMSIAQGLVVLEDLKWEATQRTGFEAAADATFSIGGALVAGVPVSGLEGVNTALEPVGLRIEAPKVNRAKDGGISISPLRVALANSPLGAQLLGPIIASARPLLAPVFDAATGVDKSLGLVGLVADIVLGVADGSGGAEVSVGGAAASTSASVFVPPAIPSVPVAPVVAPDTLIAGSSSLPGLPAALAPLDASLVPPSVATTQSVRCALQAAPRRHGECRDGHLPVAVAISGLVVAAVVAAEFASRRRRRSASEVAA